MKKLVGESGLHGKGIGKRATFGFLYHAFMIRNMNKVYIHSRDINMRNINLNSRFGFELEGVFLDDITVGDKRQDVVRMALFKSLWLRIFSQGASANQPAEHERSSPDSKFHRWRIHWARGCNSFRGKRISSSAIERGFFTSGKYVSLPMTF